MNRSKETFNLRVTEITKAINERLNVYEQVLWGGVGLMSTSTNVTQEMWHNYVRSIKIDKHWPGIQGIGFTKLLRQHEKKNFIKEMKQNGHSTFKIWPESLDETVTTIIYLEPFDWRNKRAFGYDMWTNQIRRTTMARARDLGEASTTGVITLVQETDKDVQKGFLTYLPIYKSKTLPKTLEERRENLLGWVYAPFRANDLMHGILGSKDPTIEFEIFDSETMSLSTLLYDTNNELHTTESSHNPIFKIEKKLDLQGRPWTLYFSTPKTYKISGEEQPKLIVCFGILVDLILFYVVYALYFIQKRVEKRAEDITIDLTNENTKLKMLNDELKYENIQLLKKVSDNSS